MDREKVIKGLECCTFILGRRKCNECPYQKGLPDNGCYQLQDDFHVLLKEQEAVKRTSRTGINGFSIVWTCGACGSDLHPNNAKAKYCSNCGQAVKWE